MTFTQHLGELRHRVIISLIAIAAGAAVAFGVYNNLLSLFLKPLCEVDPHHCQLYITGPLDGLSIRFNLSLWAGLFLASPVIFWQLWRFITPGLNPNEKRYSIPFVIFSILLFSLGGAVAVISFPHALAFLTSIGGPSLTTLFSPSKYFHLIIFMFIAFGVAFQFPILLVFLEISGVVTSKSLRQWRRRAILIITIIAAVITPSSDPFSMLAMGIPMVIFYEMSIIIGKLLKK